MNGIAEIMKVVDEMRSELSAPGAIAQTVVEEWCDRIEAIAKAQTPSADVLVEACAIEALRKVKHCAEVVCAKAGESGLIYARDYAIIELLDALYEADEK